MPSQRAQDHARHLEYREFLARLERERRMSENVERLYTFAKLVTDSEYLECYHVPERTDEPIVVGIAYQTCGISLFRAFLWIEDRKREPSIAALEALEECEAVQKELQELCEEHASEVGTKYGLPTIEEAYDYARDSYHSDTGLCEWHGTGKEFWQAVEGTKLATILEEY